MKNSSCKPSNNHKNMVSKLKPKIRIVHIFAPEIITTDVANFRELVQRLTGKPENDDREMKNKKPRNSQRSKTNRIENITSAAAAAESTIQLRDEEEEKGCNYGEIWGKRNDKSGEFLNGFDELNSTGMMDHIGFSHYAPHVDLLI